MTEGILNLLQFIKTTLYSFLTLKKCTVNCALHYALCTVQCTIYYVISTVLTIEQFMSNCRLCTEYCTVHSVHKNTQKSTKLSVNIDSWKNPRLVFGTQHLSSLLSQKLKSLIPIMKHPVSNCRYPDLVFRLCRVRLYDMDYT